MSIACYQCFQVLPYGPRDKIPRQGECPHCLVSLRVCKMCEHYNPHSYNECREPIAERVIDKEKANFCDSFSFGHGKSQKENKQNFFDMADRLFKK